jgi:hypothetical protein
MSMEMSVFSDRRLASTEEWQRAIATEGFGLELDATVVLDAARGFFPTRLGGKLTGFECYHNDAAELIDEYPEIDFGRHWSHAVGLRIIGNCAEVRAAWMAATAYARACGGVVWDSESGEVKSPDRAAQVARDLDRSLPQE